MTPFRVPSTGGTQIGAMWIEQQRSRVEVMGRVKAGSLRLQEAAELLGLSYRQAKQVWARYRGGGAKALQHGNCGRVSNRAHPEEFRQAVLVQVGRRYADFGPTLAAEHLEEEYGLQVAAETLRRWMKAAGLWRRQRARKPYRQRRMRKPHFGELVQLDASFHPWLEDRAANGCLMHMVDDATGTVLCQFSAGETTWAAAHLLRAWIERYGVPRALYTDWKNVYVRLPNVQERLRGEAAVTQFGQMCAKLGTASSPPVRRRPRGGWSACTVPIRTGWSRSCGWPQSATMTMPMLICRSITSPSTIATTRDRRPLKPTIIGNVPRRDNWTTCSGWRKNECSVKTGWCVTKTACCNSRGKIVTGRRLRAECGCGRTSQDTSSFTIADRACRFATFPWLLLRRGAEEGAQPLPLQPHPRNLRLPQAGLIAPLPAIILGDKAGRI